MSKQGSNFEPSTEALKPVRKKAKKLFTVEYQLTAKYRKSNRWYQPRGWVKYNGYKTEASRDDGLKALNKNGFGMYEFRKGE